MFKSTSPVCELDTSVFVLCITKMHMYVKFHQNWMTHSQVRAEKTHPIRECYSY